MFVIQFFPHQSPFHSIANNIIDDHNRNYIPYIYNNGMANSTSLFLVLGAIVLLSYFYYFSDCPIHNDGNLQTKQSSGSRNNVTNNDDQQSDQQSDDSDTHSRDTQSRDTQSRDTQSRDTQPRNAVTQDEATADDSVDSSVEIIKERAMGLNGPYFRRKNGGQYKENSYVALGNDKNYKEIDRHFKVEDVSKNYTDRFMPVDESSGQGAPIDITNNKGTEKDKYNVNSYLPQEKEKDWFETIETVDVKNSHLINIYRPIGANTIGSTHKNSTYDLRGTDKAVCPKFVVSPWLQSSIEPDRSMKSLCA